MDQREQFLLRLQRRQQVIDCRRVVTDDLPNESVPSERVPQLRGIAVL
jgi:hypothetical protein